ncbi:MAG: SIS domain-containing protein [Gammaproteobacteria bacterium]|nr:SIS domain-containing protein [Gammaproteobacteria bacterium]MDH3449448.1 SIS domain-containing protein [Gammaproteobacteria bacterium]
MLREIEKASAEMTRAERKVARVVLTGPYRILRKSIRSLASEAGVSEPTVMRFCRALSCKGFQDFKLQLAQDLATGAHFSETSLAVDEAAPDLITKVIDGGIASLIKVRDSLPADAVQAAIAMLAAADRIEFYGLGGSGIVALDAQHKFFRLGVPVVAYSDPTVHSVSASLLEPGCVIVAISQSGVTQDIIDSAELGLAAGARVIAITAADSALAMLATICLPVNPFEDQDLYAPIKSRLAHLAIIDVLAVGVALSRGPAFQNTFRQLKPAQPRSVDGLR